MAADHSKKTATSSTSARRMRGYKGFPDFTFTAGRMPNPLLSTRMVWDPDINPEGLAEQWKHTWALVAEHHRHRSYSKDGKNVASPPSRQSRG